MAKKRRKQRTHVKSTSTNAPKDGSPSSFVIKHGQVGPSLAQLVRDVRKVMEPNTASRLKERTRNKLKDYIVLGPSLHVTHLLAFTLAKVAPTLRIVRLPAGPSVTFRVERYSLMKDILHISKRARSTGLEYLTAPLLVCASFPPPGPSTPPQISLLLKTFQSLFPALSPNTLNLSSARRVVLLSYNAASESVEFRHYLITVKPYGVSRRIQKVVNGISKPSSAAHVLDLGREKDIADFFLRKKGEMGDDEGYESAASTASSVGGDDDPENAIDLADNYLGRNNKKGERRAVKLDEIGPRMELSLLKITEGLPGKEGSVMYHRFVKKTKKETARQQADHAAKERLRKQRREEQERNVAAKKAGKAEQKEDDDDEEEEEEEEEEDEDDEGDASDEWDDEAGVSESDQDSDSEEEVEPPPRPTKKHKARS